MFQKEYPEKNLYQPYLFAGTIFNVSMAWLDNDCKEPVEQIAEMFIEPINISD